MTEGAAPMFKIWTDGSRVLIDVLVVPRASRSAVSGVHDGRLKVALDAPPVDGRANDALVEFIAAAMKRPKRDVAIVRGEKSRKKTVAIAGATVKDVTALASLAE
jgi:uncharacterized protein (TIGR00251 family)